jgi:tetratricopeptide (TPR) repeat protein
MSFRTSDLYQVCRALAAVGLMGIACEHASAAATPAYDSGGSGVATNLLSDARRAAYHGRYSEAIEDDTKALALLPNYGDAFASRAEHYEDAGRYAEAAADLERVIAMRPDDMPLAMRRVRLALLHADAAAAMADVQAALKLPLRSVQHAPKEFAAGEPGDATFYHVNGHMESIAYEYESIANQILHHDDESLADMQKMLQIEAEHPEHIMASYCYVAGLAGLLESAELMCQQSIARNPHDIGQYDSLGFVHLRMEQWGKAIADYNKALADRPDLTTSLYGRGIARRATGDVAVGNADIAAATQAEPDIANIMRRLGAPAG